MNTDKHRWTYDLPQGFELRQSSAAFHAGRLLPERQRTGALQDAIAFYLCSSVFICG
jgi:hypothetical protein